MKYASGRHLEMGGRGHQGRQNKGIHHQRKLMLYIHGISIKETDK